MIDLNYFLEENFFNLYRVDEEKRVAASGKTWTRTIVRLDDKYFAIDHVEDIVYNVDEVKPEVRWIKQIVYQKI